MQLTATPHDPLIARDSRPFQAGGRVRSLEWLFPSVVAGSLRSLLGKMCGGFTPETVAALKAVRLRGPLPLLDGELYVPHPLDAVLKKEMDGSKRCIAVRPLPSGALSDGEGTNLPSGLRLATLSGLEATDEDFKPEKAPHFWSMAHMVDWLAAPDGRKDIFPARQEENRGEKGDFPPGFLASFAQDDRTHTEILPESGTVRERRYFHTTGLDFWTVAGKTRRQAAVALDVETENGKFLEALHGIDALHPLGGERRLALWEAASKGAPSWTCPDAIKSTLESCSGRVRMLLATPSVFARGWRPEWLAWDEKSGSWKGTPPGGNVTLRLVSVVVGRWRPISGWSIEREKTGPKPLRRMAPAGSVYFFEVERGAPKSLAELWLRSVCDAEQDRNDGFGAALWGAWNDAK